MQTPVSTPCAICSGKGVMDVLEKHRTVIFLESKAADTFHEIIVAECSPYVLLSSDLNRIPMKLTPEECCMIASSLRFHANNVLQDVDESLDTLVREEE